MDEHGHEQDTDASVAHEPMRPRSRGIRRNPSSDDKRVRRRNRRAAASQQEESTVTTRDRDALLAKIVSAPSLVQQARLVGELEALDRKVQAQAALEREVDFASAVVRETFTPVISTTARSTSASDWLVAEEGPEVDHSAMVAQAAQWFSNVPELVREDPQEFAEQARGRAWKIASGFGDQAEGAVQVFTEYVDFLRTQAGHKEAASGLDQIQQTTAPDGVTEKPTQLPPETFDNFAPEVADVNTAAVGTESSERNPMWGEIRAADGPGQPEKPGGHDTTDQLTWSPPEGMQPASGGSDAPEQPGGHRDGPAAKEAASMLPQIQQTIDVHDQPSTTPMPMDVAFPWTMGGPEDGLEGEAEYDQGEVRPSGHQSTAVRKQADTWTQPHQTVQPNIANTPETTPPRNVGEAGSGAADKASPNAKPSFGDAHAAGSYTESYNSGSEPERPKNVPASMGGDNGQAMKTPAYASRHVASRQEMDHADFQRGYKYAMKWRPGVPIVAPGSGELEAGIYAGLTDHPTHRTAWLTEHAELAEQHPSLGHRIALHRELTHRVAAAKGLPTDGTYLVAEAGTSVDLDTMAPGTSPSPTGDTPLEGPGRPGPLVGEDNPAAPGGPAPYNGAPPYGHPVVPNTGPVSSGTEQTIQDNGMTPPQSSLPKPVMAFRQRVQGGKLAALKQEG